MLVLAIRTDKPEAELILRKDNIDLEIYQWQAHRRLAETLHGQIIQLLNRHDCSLQNLSGVIVYAGPGSFTGLRIGTSVANALAYSLNIPINAASGEQWVNEAMAGLKETLTGYATPTYGSPATTTSPVK